MTPLSSGCCRHKQKVDTIQRRKTKQVSGDCDIELIKTSMTAPDMLALSVPDGVRRAGPARDDGDDEDGAEAAVVPDHEGPGEGPSRSPWHDVQLLV